MKIEDTIDRLLKVALANHQAGNTDQAELGYRSILKHDPNDPDALNLLGLVLQGRDDFAGSIALITRALNAQPDFPEALINLARAYRGARTPLAAADAARGAIALAPNLLEAHLQLGGALIDNDDNAGAIEALRSALHLAPNSLAAHVAMATALQRQKDHRSAAQSWKAALALKPYDAEIMVNLANSLSETGHFHEALSTYRSADALVPDDQRTQFGIAWCLVQNGDIQAAAAVCRRAVEAAPNSPALWKLLANCDAWLGNFEAAASSYRHTSMLAQGAADALHDLVVVGEGSRDEALQDQIRTVLADNSRPIRDHIAAGFSQGQSADRNGAYDEAFEAYALANRRLRSDRATRGFVYDRDVDRKLVDWQVSEIGLRAFADTAGWGDPSDLPVFIVGMPRSGTSLVEQIAASHPLVFGAGERKDISGILTALNSKQPNGEPVVWDRASVFRESTHHLLRLRNLGPGATRVIDKMPPNIMFLGQIAMLFPGARIVVCRRDPRDVCLSCFFQYFRDDAMTWTDDLADCGFRASQTERLLDHWRKVLPLPILEIQYEALIADLEGESRRLIDFLGLNWNPKCLSFHETQRAVLTASHWQVRQPLYASSVGRWQHYRHNLAPLLRELRGMIPTGEEDRAADGHCKRSPTGASDC